MRWTKRIIEVGESRIINRFLFFPLKLYKNNSYEYRWLEWVKVKQLYGWAGKGVFSYYSWQDFEFVD